MKKVIGIISLAILLTSCWAENQENQSVSGSVVQSWSVVETIQSGSQVEENQNENQSMEEKQDTQSGSQAENIQTDELLQYSLSSNSSGSVVIETQTGTQVETQIEAEVEISDSQEEQLIQETMDELNEFFELLENTDG